MLKRLKTIALPLLLITSMLFAIHYFIFITTTRTIDPSKPLYSIIFYALMGGVLLMPLGLIFSMSPLKKILFPFTMLGYLWMGFFFISWTFSIVEFVVSIFWQHTFSQWVFVASGLTSLWALFNGMRLPRTVKHKISGPPTLKGFRLAQVTDLHVGMPFLNHDWLNKVVQRINETESDAVVITGDLVDDNYVRVAPMLAPLEQIKAKVAKFYVTGNHEYIREGQWESHIKSLGVDVLHNTNKSILFGNARVLIAGVPDRMVSRFDKTKKSQPDKALANAQSVDFKILLAHEPASAFDIKSEKCDLILSGHTHGGQIFPFGIFVRIVQPAVKGFKIVNGIKVFAHQGTGYWGPPMRWLTRSEIAVFEWV
jgi:predicted MPP superfamily phosphohydrolase